MGKITQAEVEDLRKAKKTLELLQEQAGKTTGASSTLQAVMSSDTGFGPLIDGAGSKVAQFVNARAQAAQDRINLRCGPGLTTAIALLDKTITNYETNEKATKGAADDTPAGQSRSGGSGGSQHGGAN